MSTKKQENLQKDQKTQNVRNALETSATRTKSFLLEHPDILNEVKRERLREVVEHLKEEGYKQVGVARAFKINAGDLSSMLNGRRQVSDKLLINIHKFCPQYSIEWLLGLDLYANKEEEKTGNRQARSAADEWTIDFIKAISGDNLRLWEPLFFLPYDPKAPRSEKGFSIKVRGEMCLLSESDFNSLLDEVRSFVEFKLDYISKTKKRPLESGPFSEDEVFSFIDKELHDRAVELYKIKEKDPAKAIEAVIDIWKKYIVLPDDELLRAAQEALESELDELDFDENGLPSASKRVPKVAFLSLKAPRCS